MPPASLPFCSSPFQSSGFPIFSLVLKTGVYKCLQMHQVSCMCPEPLTSQYGTSRDISPLLLKIHTKNYLAFFKSQLWLNSFKKIVHFQLVKKMQQQLNGLRCSTSKMKFTFLENSCIHHSKLNMKQLLLCCDHVFANKQNIQRCHVMGSSWARDQHKSYAGSCARGPHLTSAFGWARITE